jgi:nephrocystin-3
VVSAPSENREVRVFVSSNFTEMLAERTRLAAEIFPELRRRFHKIGGELFEVDLRWGIPDAPDPSIILEACLDEVDACRPFFVVLLGDTYGWIPAESHVRLLPRVVEKFAWLDAAMAQRMSVTEMEVRYGLLLTDAPQAGVCYVRVNPGGASHQLDALQRELRERGIPTRTYDTLDELCTWCLDDLWRAILQRFPNELDLRWPLDLRRAHNAVAHVLRALYLPDLRLYDALDAFAGGPAPALLVEGASGLGKSALVANWAARRGDAFTLLHFIGSAPGSENPIAILRRIMAEIALATRAAPGSVPLEDNDVHNDFPKWLLRIDASRRPLLVLDGLNQLTIEDQQLNWLPQELPAHWRVVASTVPGAARDAADRRGWQKLQIEPLNPQRVAELTAAFLEQRGKGRVLAQFASRLSAAPQCSNPLYLKVLLEELAVGGSYERLDAQITEYLRASDPRQLFDLILDRIEREIPTC